MHHRELGVTSVLSDILSDHIEQGTITRADIADATGAGRSTVDRWVKGDCEPGWLFVRLMIQNLPEPTALALLGELTGHRYHVMPAGEPDADLNGDGRVDHEDAREAGVRITERIGKLNRAIHDALVDGRVCQKDNLTVLGQVGDLLRDGRQLRAITYELTEDRKKARTPRSPRNPRTPQPNGRAVR